MVKKLIDTWTKWMDAYAKLYLESAKHNPNGVWMWW